MPNKASVFVLKIRANRNVVVVMGNGGAAAGCAAPGPPTTTHSAVKCVQDLT